MANVAEKFVSKIDKFQQRHRFVGFPYAVIKKYGEDEAGNLAALITYYGFLSLFPLLLVVTTATQLLLKDHADLKAKVTDSVNHYFPVVGDQLQQNIHSFHRTGLALILGVLITVYGARGGANAFQNALNHIWQIPRTDRPGFPKHTGKSLTILAGGGLGIITAAILSSYATALDRIAVLRAVPILISLVLLTLIFYAILRFTVAKNGPPKKVTIKTATVAAIGIQVLQGLGTYMLSHQIHNFKTLYGTFALVLGLLFWIYLQVQVVMYAVEIGSVQALGLWPRSILTSQNMTEADKKAYSMLAKKERYLMPEKIRVHFEKKK